MINIKGKNSKDLLDSVNKNEPVKSLMNEVQETLSSFGLSKREIAKEKIKILSYYISYNSDSFAYFLTNDETLQPEKPNDNDNDNPTEESPIVEKIQSAKLTVSPTVKIHDEVQYDLTVTGTTPKVDYKVELETDGSVLKLSDDGKTIYAIDTGLGWITGRVYNEVSEIQLEKVEIKSHYELFQPLNILAKLNGENTENYIRSLNTGNDYPSYVTTLLNVDTTKNNTINYSLIGSYDNGKEQEVPQEVAKKIMHPVEDEAISKYSNGEFTLNPISDNKLPYPISFRYNFDGIVFSESKDFDVPYTDEKRVNIIGNVEKGKFTKKNWTKSSAMSKDIASKVTEVDNGLELKDGGMIVTEVPRRFNPIDSPIMIPQSANYKDRTMFMNMRITFKAKGVGQVYPCLLRNGGGEILDKTLNESIGIYSVAEYSEYTKVFKVYVKDITATVLTWAGLKVTASGDNTVSIMENSLSITSEFQFGNVELGESYPNDTKLFDYIGLPMKDNPTTKMDYLWFADGSISNRYSPTVNISKGYPIDSYELTFMGFDKGSDGLISLEDRTLHIVPINDPTKMKLTLTSGYSPIDDFSLSDRVVYEFSDDSISTDNSNRLTFSKRGTFKVKATLNNIANTNQSLTTEVEVVAVDSLEMISENCIFIPTKSDDDYPYTSNISQSPEGGYETTISKSVLETLNNEFSIYGSLVTTMNPMADNSGEDIADMYNFKYPEHTDKVQISSTSKGVSVKDNIITVDEDLGELFDLSVQYKNGFNHAYLISIAENKITEIDQNEINVESLYSSSDEYQLIGFSYDKATTIAEMDGLSATESLFYVRDWIIPMSNPITISVEVY